MASENKKKLGQFFTRNHEHILQNMKISPKIKIIIEPFCGDGDLLSFIKSQTKKDSLEAAFLSLTGNAIREETVKNQAISGRARAWRR